MVIMAKIKRKIVKKTVYFAIVDNNLNFLLSNSSIFYDNDILSENKIEFDILNSYSNKPFLITNISNYHEKKKNYLMRK